MDAFPSWLSGMGIKSRKTYHFTIDSFEEYAQLSLMVQIGRVCSWRVHHGHFLSQGKLVFVYSA